MEQQLSIPDSNNSEEDRQKLIEMERLKKRKTLKSIFNCGLGCCCLEVFMNFFAWIVADSSCYDFYYEDSHSEYYNILETFDHLKEFMIPCVFLSFIIISVFLSKFKPIISIIINSLIILIKLVLFIIYSIYLFKICRNAVPFFPIVSEILLIGDFIYYELFRLTI